MRKKRDINQGLNRLDAEMNDPKTFFIRKLMRSKTILERKVIPSTHIPKDQLTVTGDLPPLVMECTLKSSGNTTTLSPKSSGNIFLMGDNGWDQFPLLADTTVSTVGYTSGRLYNVYIFPNQNIEPPQPALETEIWTDETTPPATEIKDGAVVKTGDNSRRLLAVCRYNGSTLLVPKYDPNGEIIFGTGDPRNNVADPHTGVGMSAGGVTFGSYVWQFWAALNGVVGVGFNALGQLIAGAGKLFMDISGITFSAGVYPSSAYAFWRADDTNAIVAQILGTYGGAAVNSGLVLDGVAHDATKTGFVILRELDETLVEKNRLILRSDGVVADFTLRPGLKDTQQINIIGTVTTADQNKMNSLLSLYTRVESAGTPMNGLGSAITFFAHDSADNDQTLGFFGLRYTDVTNTSEDAEFVFGRRVAGAEVSSAITEFAFTLLDDASAAAMRTTLGVAIGSNVQAWDADLDYLASFTPSANVKSILNAADYAAIRTLMSLTALATTTPAANVATFLATPSSANLRAALTDESGTGAAVFADTPTISTPVFSGTPTGTITAGTYTPTLTNTTNVAASTSAQCNYMRIGNQVTVSGRIAIDPTAAVATLLEISLPIASNFGGAADCGGVAACGSVASMSAAIDANTTNDTANLSYIATDLANRVWAFQFMYEVI